MKRGSIEAIPPKLIAAGILPPKDSRNWNRDQWREWIAIYSERESNPFLCDDPRPKVGFVLAAYMRVGGVESWHRSILPRLKNHRVAGVVVVGDTHGNDGLLRCPFRTGLDAARQLAHAADTLVVWGLSDMQAIWQDNRPNRVIAMHHGDTRSPWAMSVAREQLKDADVLLCVHPEVAKELGGVLIPNPVDPSRALSPKVSVRAQFSLCRHKKICTWMHRVSMEKNPLFAVEVARYLPRDWLMVMAGGGNCQEQLRAKLHDRISYVGPWDHPADWLAASSVFLSTADQEGFGLSIAEAMLAGVPVVSGPYGIAATPGLARTLSLEDSPKQWAKAIVESYGQDTTYARQYIEQHYSPQRTIEALEKYL